MNFCIMFSIMPNTDTAKRLDLPSVPGHDIAEIDGSMHNIPAASMLTLIGELLKNPDVTSFMVRPATEHADGDKPHEMRH